MLWHFSAIDKLKSDIIKFARLSYNAGLTDSHGGNISARFDRYIIIKKSGKMMCCLKKEDLIETTIEENPKMDKKASVELIVHRAIYKNFPHAGAVIHLHSPYAIAASIKEKHSAITPMDSESKLILGKIPILDAKKTISSPEVAKKIVKLLKDHQGVIVKSHGTFTAGKTLEEAFKYASIIENACKIIHICST